MFYLIVFLKIQRRRRRPKEFPLPSTTAGSDSFFFSSYNLKKLPVDSSVQWKAKKKNLNIHMHLYSWGQPEIIEKM